MDQEQKPTPEKADAPVEQKNDQSTAQQIKQRIAAERAINRLAARIHSQTYAVVKHNLEGHKKSGASATLDEAMVVFVVGEFAKLLVDQKLLKPSKEVEAVVNLAARVMAPAAVKARGEVDANRIINPGR